jgi:16S rRNA (guanine527-N7)-methyltransferase
MSLLIKYFPELNPTQTEQFRRLHRLFLEWNKKINLISRNDTVHFEERHILHSLSIAKFTTFKKGTRIADVGTGGGFPGIPLAILFPDTQFYLVDSIGKKIMVVSELIKELGLTNCTPVVARAENLKEHFHFITSRAVTAFPAFFQLTRNLINGNQFNDLKNGIIYLKGGDFNEELFNFREKAQVTDISNYFTEEFFSTKKIIYLPVHNSPVNAVQKLALKK